MSQLNPDNSGPSAEAFRLVVLPIAAENARPVAMMSAVEDRQLRPFGHRAVSVMPHFSPSHETVLTSSLPSATAAVEIEASLFEPARKSQHSREIRSSP